MTAPAQRYRIHPGRYAVVRLAADAALPEWMQGAFTNVTRTPDEVSIICAADAVPGAVAAERGWRLLQVLGPFNFDAVGVLSGLVGPLAAARVSVLAVATFETDYLLVKEGSLERACTALAAAGHQVVEERGT